MPDANAVHAHQFDDAEQQHESSWLGMWVFLATEIMFFGGMFLAYTSYRLAYTEAFATASNELNIVLGTINTAVLIASSLTMALAVHSAQVDRLKALAGFVSLTFVLGAVFLGIKVAEYHAKFEENLIPGASFAFEPDLVNQAEIFFSLYFAMTGMHALHMVLGLGLLGYLAYAALRRRFSAAYTTPVELVGLYWHFVDVVWIFLFPLLYLLGRHS